MADAGDLYDEFGNYIGPELSESEQVRRWLVWVLGQAAATAACTAACAAGRFVHVLCCITCCSVAVQPEQQLAVHYALCIMQLHASLPLPPLPRLHVLPLRVLLARAAVSLPVLLRRRGRDLKGGSAARRAPRSSGLPRALFDAPPAFWLAPRCLQPIQRYSGGTAVEGLWNLALGGGARSRQPSRRARQAVLRPGALAPPPCTLVPPLVPHPDCSASFAPLFFLLLSSPPRPSLPALPARRPSAPHDSCLTSTRLPAHLRAAAARVICCRIHRHQWACGETDGQGRGGTVHRRRGMPPPTSVLCAELVEGAVPAC